MINGVTSFDFEVTSHDWLVVMKDLDSGSYFRFHNDNDGIRYFIESNPWLCGFNTKRYDSHILKAVCAGFSPEEVKVVNDRIILEGMNGWDVPELRDVRAYFDIIDLADDCQQGTSLKGFEAHMGMNIKETDVSFDIDRPLTFQEVQMMFNYCREDVKATEVLFNVRLPYLENKINLGRKCGLTDREALKLTNAKLTAKYLKAERPEKAWTDERNYQIPSNLKREYIPKEILDFYESIHDESMPDELCFSRKLDAKLGRCEATISFGGIHAAIPHYTWKEGGDADENPT